MRLAWFLFVLIIAAGGGAGYWAWFATPAANGETAGQAAAPVPVEAAPVRIDTVLRQIRAVGTLRSNESVLIASEVSGRILEIAGVEGQAVVRGRVILRLDPAIYEAELAQARAALALSERNYKRATDLKASGAGTGQRRTLPSAATHTHVLPSRVKVTARIDPRSTAGGPTGLRVATSQSWADPLS